MKSHFQGLWVHIWVVVFILGFGGLRVFGETAAQETGEGINLEWAFGVRTGPEENRQLLAITRDTSLVTGDELKMFIRLWKPCFLYMIYRNQEGLVQVWFPGEKQQTTPETGVEVFIPESLFWFKLDDPPGPKTFFFLASENPLSELEALLSEYREADTSQKPGISSRMVSQIREIHKRDRQLTAFAERPLPIAGQVRGVLDQKTPEDNAALVRMAVWITATSFFSKTITIDHVE